MQTTWARIAVLVFILALSHGAIASGQTPAPASAATYDKHVSEARSLTMKGQASAAATAAETAIRLDDRRWEAFVAAAGAYAAQGLLDDAIGLLQLGLVRAPESRKAAVREAIVELRTRVLAAASSTSKSAASVARRSPAAPRPQATARTTARTPPRRTIRVAPSSVGYVNIRGSADAKSAVVGTVKPGETYDVSEVVNGWYRIEAKRGWIAGRYVIVE